MLQFAHQQERNLVGISRVLVPAKLVGQTPAYLNTTIGEFRSGKRGNSPGMSDLLRIYSDDDIKAIVTCLSSRD